MLDFPEKLRIPFGEWIKSLTDWLLENLGDELSSIGRGINLMLGIFEDFFTIIPWFIFIPLVFVLAWYITKNLKSSIAMFLMLILIGSFSYWDMAMKTLSLVFASVLFSLIIGIPIGISMAQNDRTESILKPVLDAMQTLPSFVYLIPALMFFSIGKAPAMLATIIYAVPPVIRLTNVGIRTVDPEAVEAAKAFGAKRKQVLWYVQIPLAKPSILVGINQTTMMALAMVVIGSMVGAKGLGMEVLESVQAVEIDRGFESGFSIVFLAIIIDRLTNAIARRSQKQ